MSQTPYAHQQTDKMNQLSIQSHRKTLQIIQLIKFRVNMKPLAGDNLIQNRQGYIVTFIHMGMLSFEKAEIPC